MNLRFTFIPRAAAALLGGIAAALIFAGTEAHASLPSCSESASAPEQGESYPAYWTRARRRECLKPWTVLVYMAADNDLAPFAYWDLYEMEAGFASGRHAAGSTSRSDLLVQLRTSQSLTSSRLHIFQSQEIYDPEIPFMGFRHRDESFIHSPVVARVPRVDNGSLVTAADDLAKFLEWGMRDYPAEHYLVVVWGHGQGWAPASRGQRFGGLAFSNDGKSFLDTPALHQALRRAEENALGGKTVDIYASDACLMQTIEVAAEISDSARWIVGSSQIEDSWGLPYRRLMYEINTKDLGGDEAFTLAHRLPHLSRLALQPGGLHARFSSRAVDTLTWSTISSDELRKALVPGLKNLGRALLHFLRERPLRKITLSSLLLNTPSFLGGSQDLGGFLELLKNLVDDERAEAGTLLPAAQELDLAIQIAKDALDRTTVSYALGNAYPSPELRALAVWLPHSSEDFRLRMDDFTSSAFYQATEGSWNGWMRELFL